MAGISIQNKDVREIVEKALEDKIHKEADDFRAALRYERAEEILELVNLCAKVKQEPSKLLSKLFELFANEMLNNVAPVFGAFFVDEISVEAQLNVTGSSEDSERGKRDREKSINAQNIDRFNLTFSLKPINPYVEASFIIGEFRISSIRLIFQIDIIVRIEKLSIIESNNKTKIGMNDVDIKLTISLAKLEISYFGRQYEAKKSHITIGFHPDEELKSNLKLWETEFSIKDLLMLHRKEIPVDDQDKVSSTLIPNLSISVTKKILEEESKHSHADIIHVPQPRKCPVCTKIIRADYFCPECGSRLKNQV